MDHENEKSKRKTRELVYLEEYLLDLLLKGSDDIQPRTMFVLGAPRTGSTVLYQSLSARLGLPYISNLVNDCFPQTPIVGLTIQKAFPVEISFTSQYGKTSGKFQPSEGSAVMAHWFGGGHPSALVSTRIFEGKMQHFMITLAAADALFGRPLSSQECLELLPNPLSCGSAAVRMFRLDPAGRCGSRQVGSCSALRDQGLSDNVEFGDPSQCRRIAATAANRPSRRKPV